MNRVSKTSPARSGWFSGEGAPISVTLLLAVAILADALSFFRSPPRPHQVMATTPPVYHPAPPRAASIVDAHLFGVATATTEPLDRASASSAPLKLTGTIVWEGDASRGYAILGPSEQQTKAFSPGMSVDNGARLDRVFRDHVRLAMNGGYTTIALPHNALRGLLALPSGPRTASDAMSAERTWLGELVAQPSFEDGNFQGFVLSPTKQVRQRFGLREGDVVTQINGIALDHPTSAEGVLQKLGATMVLMTIIRNGSPQIVSMDMSGS